MGGHPYYYVVPYQQDVERALAVLRENEFRAGRYYPAMPRLTFGAPDFWQQRPGARHASIHDAMDDADACGTRSILDVIGVGDQPDYGVAAPLTEAELAALLDTATPTRARVEERLGDLLEDIERGQCRYVILYADGRPSEILFAGYSYD
jgi:hypothetical protein